MLMQRPMTRNAAANASAADRRLNQRHDGSGLQVEVEGRVHPVVDVSTGGLSLVGLNRTLGERFRFVLSRVGESQGVTGEAEVLGIRDGLFHLTFTRPTLPLMRLVIAHVSAMTGVDPHLLKSR